MDRSGTLKEYKLTLGGPIWLKFRARVLRDVLSKTVSGIMDKVICHGSTARRRISTGITLDWRGTQNVGMHISAPGNFIKKVRHGFGGHVVGMLLVISASPSHGYLTTYIRRSTIRTLFD